MRTLHVLEVVGNGIVGGMESVVLRLLERLPRPQFRITVLCPFEGAFSARVRAMGCDCLLMPMPLDASWNAIHATCALIASRGIDVVHAHLENAHTLAGIAGRLSGRPVLATVHGRQLAMADLEVHRSAGTHLSTVCQASQLHALGVGAVPARVHCIPNGVDTTRFCPAPAAAASAVAAVSALSAISAAPAAPAAPAGNAPRIGFVGRLAPEKGPDVFVRAAALLRSRVPDARFVMVGDGPLRQRLQALRTEQRLGTRLRFDGVRDDMPAVYRELDVLVSSSFSEAMPLAVMEAMASGLPVVATRVGGVPELLEHDHSGWLCDAGDADGIAQALARIAGDPAERVRLGTAARARMAQHFELDRSVAATAALLQRLAALSRGTAIDLAGEPGVVAANGAAVTTLSAVTPVPAHVDAAVAAAR